MQNQKQNELRFGVEFTRAQIESILANNDVSQIVVSGTYSYQGENVWETNAMGQGYDINKIALGMPVSCCIQPCPTGNKS